MYKRKITQFAEMTDGKESLIRSRELLGQSTRCQRIIQHNSLLFVDLIPFCMNRSGSSGRYKQPTQIDLVWFEAMARINAHRVGE